MAGLAGQVEKDVLALHQVLHAVLIPHVGDVDPHPVLDTGDVEQVTAVLGDQAVHQGHLRALVHQPAGQVGADEAQPAGDKNPAIGKSFSHVGSRSYSTL